MARPKGWPLWLGLTLAVAMGVVFAAGVQRGTAPHGSSAPDITRAKAAMQSVTADVAEVRHLANQRRWQSATDKASRAQADWVVMQRETQLTNANVSRGLTTLEAATRQHDAGAVAVETGRVLRLLALLKGVIR